eukprot:TRINITY_DN8984_c0_g1_i1.p1 TRINITY_DN8984_c0_g1~~TRINITY_DN8984_c0_g1_i1.p1  ORF type:complete len:750 (+),score=129.74 TRINITY_DN8984_c0_g1_i1:99-2348(+)
MPQPARMGDVLPCVSACACLQGLVAMRRRKPHGLEEAPSGAISSSSDDSQSLEVQGVRSEPFTTTTSCALTPASRSKAKRLTNGTPFGKGLQRRNTFAVPEGTKDRRSVVEFDMDMDTLGRALSAHEGEAFGRQDTDGFASSLRHNLNTVFGKFCKEKTSSFHFDDFEQICVNELQLGLDKAELLRLFHRIDTDRSGSINVAEFRQGIVNSERFRSIANDYDKDLDDEVPSDYDFGSATTDAHCHEDYSVDVCAEPARSPYKAYNSEYHGSLHGSLVPIRRKLDFSYHVNYTERRQLWQDRMVARVARCTSPTSRPWVVFTCGAMGAGKGHTMNWLSKQNFFPLEDIVHIDPDHFKRLMPEWEGYTTHNQLEAGTMCHQESGLLQELAQEVALERSQNVWIDGSLRDHVWYTQVFADIRARFPKYRIAIFYVYCSIEEVLRRAEQRGHDTGRFIPEAKLRSSAEETRLSITKLAPLADFVARINNEIAIPFLESCEDRTHSYNTIQSTFRLNRQKGEFPQAMPALSFMRHQRLSEQLRLPPAIMTAGQGSKLRTLRLLDVCTTTLAESLVGQSQRTADMFIQLSPFAEVNFDRLTREVAGVPADAASFAFCHGCFLPRADNSGGTDDPVLAEWPPIVARLAASWFWLDGSGNLCGVSVACNEEKAASSCQNSLHFQSPDFVSDQIAQRFEDSHRWVSPAVLPQSAAKLASAMAWVLPDELSCAPYGGLAYRLKGDDSKPPIVFPVGSSE